MNQPIPMSFPLLMPFTGPQQQSTSHLNQVPARVQMALSFLQDLNIKTMERIAANDVGFETVEGQKLVDEEVWAKNAACNLLRKYFDGSLRPNEWERLLLRSGPKYPPNEKGVLINCIQCHGHYSPPRPDCVFCRGTGSLLVFPTASKSGGD